LRIEIKITGKIEYDLITNVYSIDDRFYTVRFVEKPPIRPSLKKKE